MDTALFVKKKNVFNFPSVGLKIKKNVNPFVFKTTPGFYLFYIINPQKLMIT
jgi:hypothetical protein